MERKVISVNVLVIRYYHAGLGDHYYTTDFSIFGNGRDGWAYQWVQCYVYATQVPGTRPLYRYYNSQNQVYFYTTNWNELGSGALGYAFPTIVAYVY
ncbi:hypothetical protein [Chitinophaga pinensis]|uniref:DUF5648 domain-containing protein n=1 Tax=Chitinophaga pinensis (strain ATCC 43595 / DSM 2588 / LMG 13176 / NBRC 15968 / NCIMB 11800 / UQM 2034) TaxID=485918 RepID=A0A979G9R7_CHIPD|nr:hypothetical protein [Chitinophaga pinensis]ACU63401.1 conserved hypothetical protein [Chitinophaga pinensis DSM 2588]